MQTPGGYRKLNTSFLLDEEYVGLIKNVKKKSKIIVGHNGKIHLTISVLRLEVGVMVASLPLQSRLQSKNGLHRVEIS